MATAKANSAAKKVSLGLWDFERETTNYAVFIQPIEGKARPMSQYVPIAVFEQMGQPDVIRIEVAPA